MATVRQKLAASIYIKKLREKRRTVSMRQVILEAGYSEHTADHPKELIESKGWQDLMEENLPDSLLLQKHTDLLNKQEFIAIGKKGDREVLSTGEIDPDAVAKGLDMAYKLKGKYIADKKNPEDPYAKLTDDEIKQRLDELEKQKQDLNSQNSDAQAS